MTRYWWLLPLAACVLYRRRACLGCAMIDLGARLLPEPDLTGDEVDELITRAIVDYHNRTNGYEYEYAEYLP